MSPHSCITSAFQAPAAIQWEQQLGLSFADPAESQPLQLTPLPSIQLAGSFPLFGNSGLEHIFDSDSDDDDLQPWMQVAIKQEPDSAELQLPVSAALAKQPTPVPDNNAMGKFNTATSPADAGAAVALLKQKQSGAAQDHMRSYLAQLSDVQSTLRERAALAAKLADATGQANNTTGVLDTCDNSSEEDYGSDDQDDDDMSDDADFDATPADRSSFNKRNPANASNLQQAPGARTTQPASGNAAPAEAGATPSAPAAAAPTAADDGFEATLQYLAQLSDVQATLHQNATLAATLHGPASSPQSPTTGPMSPKAAAAAGGSSNPSSPSRKRRRGADVGSSKQPGVAAVATAAGQSAAVQAGAVGVGASTRQSSFKGVEYLPAEAKWQAYMYDSRVGEVVFLDKYEHELDAALAHDREMLKRLGSAVTADQLNFSCSANRDPLSAAAAAVAAALDIKLPPAAPLVTSWAAPAAAAAAAGGRQGQQQQQPQKLAAAAAWAAAHEAQASAAVPESRYKGVEYLPAEAKWQAYMLDTAVNTVVWLDKHSSELAAAEAHDAAVIGKLGAAAAVAAGQINFPERIPAASLQQSQQQQQQQPGLPVPELSIAPLRLHGTGLGSPTAAAAAAAVAPGSSPTAAAAAAAAAGDGSSPKGRGARGARGGARADKNSKPISQYKGVSWSSSCHKWAAVIWDRASKKARHVGVYGSEEEAARAYDREVIATQGAKNTGLNFRDSVDRYRAEVGEPQAAAETAAPAKANSSEYRGVSWHERSKRWEARAWGSGRQHFVGSFSSSIEAARAYDKAILKLGGAGPKSASRLNFPLTDYDLEEIAAMNFPQGNAAKKPPAKRARKQTAAHAAESDDE